MSLFVNEEFYHQLHVTGTGPLPAGQGSLLLVHLHLHLRHAVAGGWWLAGWRLELHFGICHAQEQQACLSPP